MLINMCVFIHFLLVYWFAVIALFRLSPFNMIYWNVMIVPGYQDFSYFTSCYQCIYHLGGGGYMDAWMNSA